MRFVVLAALVGGAVIVASESSARDRSSRPLPRDGALTFIADTTPVATLVAIGPRGKLRAVWSCPGRVWCGEFSGAAWAPDGRRLALSFDEIAGRSLYVGLHIVDVTTGRDVQIPAPPRNGSLSERLATLGKRNTRLLGCFTPSELDWSPDGTRLAYICSDGVGNPTQIYLIRGDGSDRTLLRTGPPAMLSSPSWSPDGKRIAYAAQQDGPSSIYLVDLDGSHRQLLVREGTAPAWSPDGTKIAYQTTCGVKLVSPTGTTISTHRAAQCLPGTPVWSPDGKKIALANPSGIYLMNENGTHLTRLTRQRGRGTLLGDTGTARPTWRSLP